MSNKEFLLGIKSYEEFDKNREKFKAADFVDRDVQEHISELFGKAYAPKDMHREVKLVDEG